MELRRKLGDVQDKLSEAMEENKTLRRESIKRKDKEGWKLLKVQRSVSEDKLRGALEMKINDHLARLSSVQDQVEIRKNPLGDEQAGNIVNYVTYMRVSPEMFAAIEAQKFVLDYPYSSIDLKLVK